MVKRLLLLVLVPAALLAYARLGSTPILMHSWNSVVEYYAPPFTTQPAAGRVGTPLTEQVVVVMVDALRDDASRRMPAVNALRSRGASLTMKAGQPSLSLPGWSVIGTGAWQERSGVTTNWYKGAVKVDSIFAQAKKSGLTTALVGSADWKQLYGPYLDTTVAITMPANAYSDVAAVAKQDDAALQAALTILASDKKPALLLLAFSGADEAGHGYGGASPVYAQVVSGIDDRIAKLVAALDLSRTTLIVTADHGTIDTGGHGGWEDSVLRIPFVAAGKAIRQGAYADADQTDLAPTVAVLLGTSIPTNSQGRGLLDQLDMPDKARSERAYDIAKELSAVHTLYATQIGAMPLDQKRLITAEDATSRGDYAAAYGASREFSLEIGRQADAAREARLASERTGRLPMVAILLLPFAFWAVVIIAQRFPTGAPLLGALAYFAVYYGLFFSGGNQFSLSAFNSEDQIQAYLTQRGTDALIALVVGAVVAGIFSRRKGFFLSAMAGVNTMYFVALGLAAQILLFFWLWNWEFPWYLPDMAMAFKYYLDMVQSSVFWPLPSVPAAAVVPLLTAIVGWIVSIGRRPAATTTSA